MISDEQYKRESDAQKSGFWTGVKITLMAVALVVSFIYLFIN